MKILWRNSFLKGCLLAGAVCVAQLAGVSACSAEPSPPVPPGVGTTQEVAPDSALLADLRERMDEARARLSLTEEQAGQIAPILRAALDATLGVLTEHGIDISDRSGDRGRLGLLALRRLSRDLDAVRAETLENVRPLLSDAQFEEFEKMQEERREALRRRLRSDRNGVGEKG